MNEIVNLVVDGKITTKEQAAALVEQEVTGIVEFYKLPRKKARAALLHNIGYVTGYLDIKRADQMMDLFDTEHPIFGRSHPTAEEALKMGMEWAAKHMHRRKAER